MCSFLYSSLLFFRFSRSWIISYWISSTTRPSGVPVPARNWRNHLGGVAWRKKPRGWRHLMSWNSLGREIYSTLRKINRACEKKSLPKRKRSSSNHQCSGAMLVSGRVDINLLLQWLLMMSYSPTCFECLDMHQRQGWTFFCRKRSARFPCGFVSSDKINVPVFMWVVDYPES